MENILELILDCKNKNLNETQIKLFENQINSFALTARQSINNEHYTLFLNTLGYAYRLKDSAQRLYYTFNEAVSAVDIATLTKDVKSLDTYMCIYSMVLDICILDYLKKEVPLDEIEKAISIYKELEKEKSKENKKYHAYQY